MKRVLALLLAVATLCVCFVSCGENSQGTGETPTDTAAPDIKVGVILLHDESVGYDKAHMDGIEAAAETLNIPDDQIIWKKSIPEEAACADAARDLASQECDIIFSDSYGHQDFMLEVAEEFPDITFVSMTGDKAAVCGLDNYKNAFTKVFESRYVSGVVAGMKLQELIDGDKLSDENFDADGNVKIGYVGAFNYAEVVSGYTAFYLGAKSIVDNVTMEVEYTKSWADESAEGASAESLAAKGCVIISQHADTTGAPAAIEKLHQAGQEVYSVGYNISMLEAAPTAALTSASNNWSAYYTYALQCMINGEEVATNWSEGYAGNAVHITELGDACAQGTQEKVDEVEAALKDGSLQVFDTSKFTVDGKEVTSHTFNSSITDFATGEVLYQGEEYETIENGAFQESKFRSAPYFDLRIDGIIENAMD